MIWRAPSRMRAAVRISGSRRVDHGRPGRPRSIAPQLVMGLLIIVVGVLFTLENLGLLEARDYLRILAGGPHRGRAHETVAGGSGGAGCTAALRLRGRLAACCESMANRHDQPVESLARAPRRSSGRRWSGAACSGPPGRARRAHADSHSTSARWPCWRASIAATTREHFAAAT